MASKCLKHFAAASGFESALQAWWIRMQGEAVRRICARTLAKEKKAMRGNKGERKAVLPGPGDLVIRLTG